MGGRRGYRIAKRALDVAVALVGMAAFSWLFALVALLVKLTSRGPVLFRQARAGLGGRPFTLLKFRTMREDAELARGALARQSEMNGPVFKMRNDPRMTRLGRFLRRSSLDELPQLLNVLAGQMSLVGPRPLPLDEARQLPPEHQRRHDVSPGLTGLWQVRGRNALPYPEMMRLDIEYVEHCSLWLDLRILLATIPAVLSGRGAF
ncbi:MAG: sugar transferase [Planctomycetes bacterium]|nr:sugar transferase [Planctomycetota bacterium]